MKSGKEKDYEIFLIGAVWESMWPDAPVMALKA
jgi:hypothetical protein